jgi:hypothetical protein
MLKSLRNNTKTVIWATVGIFILSFVISSVLSIRGKKSAAGVIVNGAATDQNPATEPRTNPIFTPDFTVYGPWMTDPASDGIGQDLYVTVQEVQTYFLPVVSKDSYNGKLVHVAEPPEAPSDATIDIAPPRVNEENIKAIEIVEELMQRDTNGLSAFDARVENAKRHLYDVSDYYYSDNSGMIKLKINSM